MKVTPLGPNPMCSPFSYLLASSKDAVKGTVGNVLECCKMEAVSGKQWIHSRPKGDYILRNHPGIPSHSTPIKDLKPLHIGGTNKKLQPSSWLD